MKRLALVFVLSAVPFLVVSGTVFAKGNGLTQASVEHADGCASPGTS